MEVNNYPTNFYQFLFRYHTWDICMQDRENNLAEIHIFFIKIFSIICNRSNLQNIWDQVYSNSYICNIENSKNGVIFQKKFKTPSVRKKILITTDPSISGSILQMEDNSLDLLNPEQSNFAESLSCLFFKFHNMYVCVLQSGTPDL